MNNVKKIISKKSLKLRKNTKNKDIQITFLKIGKPNIYIYIKNINYQIFFMHVYLPKNEIYSV
jgi:hypothetical protein